MDRRKFLAATGTGLGMALAGCMGFGGGGGSSSSEYELDSDKEKHAVGDTVKYGGLEVTISDPVLADHYAPYDCGGRRLWEEQEAVECSPPAIDDFEQPPTQGGQFMAVQITMEHVGERRISIPVSADNFDLVNGGYAENEFLVEAPWVSAKEVFPSWVFFVTEHSMNEQGVFPGVAVRGYIAFEVPIQTDLNELTSVIRWAGNADTEEESYWDITEDDVRDLTNAEPPEHGGEVFYEPNPGGIKWGDSGPGDGADRGEGINWRFDGEGEYHVPDEQNSSSSGNQTDDSGINWGT